MMTPDLALQTAIRSKLIADSVISQHVTPERIRTGIVRDEDMPVIILAPARIMINGRAAGHQIVAEIRSMVHVWAVEDGTDTPYQIASASMAALMDAPRGDGFKIDDWERPVLTWVPDVRAEVSYAHAVIGLRAVIRWEAVA